jgi:Uma2 family endonuclease
MLSAMHEPSLEESIRRISRKEYRQMVEAGIFEEDEPVELLDGLLVTKMSRGEPHDRALVWLNRVFTRALDDSLEVRPQCAFAASDWSEPEPDLAIVRTQPELWDHPSDALLVIEISDSSLRRDRMWKQTIYAKAGIPEYWVVNVQDGSVEVYTEPTPSGYARKQTFRGGDVLRPTLLAGIDIAVADMPRAPRH